MKILFIGDVGAGKTSLIYRLAENKFYENYYGSIGIDFRIKYHDIDSKTKLKI